MRLNNQKGYSLPELAILTLFVIFLMTLLPDIINYGIKSLYLNNAVETACRQMSIDGGMNRQTYRDLQQNMNLRGINSDDVDIHCDTWQPIQHGGEVRIRVQMAYRFKSLSAFTENPPGAIIKAERSNVSQMYFRN